jgi:hypothetical protein
MESLTDLRLGAENTSATLDEWLHFNRADSGQKNAPVPGGEGRGEISVQPVWKGCNRVSYILMR